MTKAEEILKQVDIDVYFYSNAARRELLSGIEQYAKEQAIAFVKWAAENNYESGFNLNGELEYNDLSYEYFSPSEMYENFLTYQTQTTNT